MNLLFLGPSLLHKIVLVCVNNYYSTQVYTCKYVICWSILDMKMLFAGPCYCMTLCMYVSTSLIPINTLFAGPY